VANATPTTPPAPPGVGLDGETFDDVEVAPVEAPKTYRGRRAAAPAGVRGPVEVTVEQGSERRPLARCGDRSPDGFEWGYVGAGPAALALALLTDHLGYEPPAGLVEHFLQGVVARMPHHGWAVAGSSLAAWLGLHLTSPEMP
jgi:Family of unknown function (DUF6166)